MICLRNACLATLLLATPGLLRAQKMAAVLVSVVDTTGMPIPYALVNAGSRVHRVADETGVAVLNMAMRDSLELHVRRIGYRESYGWVTPSEDGHFVVELMPVAASLAAVTVSERANIPLANRGFYDRVERVRKGAFVGEFLTPEELDAMNESTLTGMLRHTRYARISRTRPRRGGTGKSMVLGRGGCSMNIVLDGQLLTGTAQESSGGELPTSIVGDGTSRDKLFPHPEVDALIVGRSIMAIEVYASTANAPAELIPFGGNGACGIVAIWTGGRQ